MSAAFLSKGLLPEEAAILEPSSEDLMARMDRDRHDQALLKDEPIPQDLKPLHMEPMSLALELPWHRNEAQEQKFKRTVIGFLIFMLFILLVLTFSPVVEREKIKDDKVVAKTKVILKPVTVTPIEVEKPKPKPKPKPKQAVVKKAQPKAEAKSVKAKPKSESKPVSHGLSQVSSQLSALRNSFDLTRNQKKNVSVSNAGKAKKTSRTLLGKDSATKKSDGIKIESAVMLDDRTTLAAHNAASVEGIDHGGVDGGDPTSRYASHISSQRTLESVRLVLEAKKGQVNALYFRALVDNPSLSGKYVFNMMVHPDGSISNLKMVSSELGLNSLEKNILSRIASIRFPKEDVEKLNLTYTFHFLPN